MKRCIILACLVATQFAHGANVKTIRELSSSNGVRLYSSEFHELYENLTNCIVTTNKGKEVILIPKNGENDIIMNSEYFLQVCKPLITNVNYHMNGRWIVTRTYSNNRTVFEEFNLLIKDVQEIVDIIPESSITIYEGNYAIFRIAEEFPTDFESCSLSNSKTQVEIDLFSEEYSYLRIHKPGVCGIRMKVDKNSTGSWTLYADVRSNETYYGSFSINIAYPEEEDTKPEVVYFQLGESAEVTFSRKIARITFCQMEDPTGKKWDIQSGNCIHKIPFVTKLHEGLWKVYYGVRGSNTPMMANIMVATFDSAPLNATVTYEENEHINLLCSVIKRGHEVKYCRFTRPDNITFSVTPGVGNERYEYYEKGFARRSMIVSDCGLTIKSPSAEDFGAWKCMIQIDDKISGTILRTDNLMQKFVVMENVKTYGSKVYVERGKQFTVKCSADAVLNYCWMLSPNGTVYSVSEEESSPSHLTYEGSGFEMGECGAIVTVADDTHLGEWSCRMGVLNGTEVEASVSVTVTDSFLIADENTIDISSKKPTILTCRILPGYDFVISYCRWIRPDGRGIYNPVDNQYQTEETLSSCKLTIQELNLGYDIGSWSCIAGVAGPKNIEASSQIQINYSSMGLGGFVAVALTIALLIITTITLFVIIVRKRRNIYPDEKVIIYK